MQHCTDNVSSVNPSVSSDLFASSSDLLSDQHPISNVGLSTLHTSPCVSAPTVKIALGGDLLELKGPRIPRPGIGGKRGRIRGYSAASRRRLLRLMASVDRNAVGLPLFVTLTYPAVWSPDPERWKRDLDTFLKRLQRRFPKVAVIWKLEPQKRGAPHYHLVIFGVSYIDRYWLRQAWYEIVGSDDLRHLQAGTQVKRVKSWRGVGAYASKYLGKVGDEANFPEYAGRWWGFVGRNFLPVVWYAQRLDLGPFYVMRRVLRRYLRSHNVRLRSRRFSGVSVFLDSTAGLRLLDFCQRGAL